jgi:hypothetical protein
MATKNDSSSGGTGNGFQFTIDIAEIELTDEEVERSVMRSRNTPWKRFGKSPARSPKESPSRTSKSFM